MSICNTDPESHALKPELRSLKIKSGTFGLRAQKKSFIYGNSWLLFFSSLGPLVLKNKNEKRARSHLLHAHRLIPNIPRRINIRTPAPDLVRSAPELSPLPAEHYALPDFRLDQQTSSPKVLKPFSYLADVLSNPKDGAIIRIPNGPVYVYMLPFIDATASTNGKHWIIAPAEG